MWFGFRIHWTASQNWGISPAGARDGAPHPILFLPLVTIPFMALIIYCERQIWHFIELDFTYLVSLTLMNGLNVAFCLDSDQKEPIEIQAACFTERSYLDFVSHAIMMTSGIARKPPLMEQLPTGWWGWTRSQKFWGEEIYFGGQEVTMAWCTSGQAVPQLALA